MKPAGQDLGAVSLPEWATVPLQTRTNASRFWIMLLLSLGVRARDDRATDNAEFRPQPPSVKSEPASTTALVQLTLNQRVPGSSPGAPTIKLDLAKVCRSNVKVTAEAVFRVRQVVAKPAATPGTRGPGGTARKTAWAAFPAAAQLDRCDRFGHFRIGAFTYPKISPAAQHDHAPAAAHPLGELRRAVLKLRVSAKSPQSEAIGRDRNAVAFRTNRSGCYDEKVVA